MKHLSIKSRVYLIMAIAAFKQSSYLACSSLSSSTLSDSSSISPVNRMSTTLISQSSMDAVPQSRAPEQDHSISARNDSFNSTLVHEGAKTTFIEHLLDNRNKSSFLPVEMPVRELANVLSRALVTTIANKREIRSTIRHLLDHLLEVNSTDYILNSMITVRPDIQEKLSDAVRRLKKHEPIQYIIGSVHFAGNLFKVTPAVLIPRPETEEWVTFLMHSVSSPASILDIGTGSGCIAIALKQKFPHAIVDAIDVSREALDVARSNAAHLGVQVQFTEANVLTEPLPTRNNWSLIVSNPPYVLQREKPLMQPNVLDYEPHAALFVDDARPLLFYERIIHLATHRLNSNGILSFEVSEAFGKEVVGLLNRANFKSVSLHKDLQGKERWVTAIFEDMLDI